MPDEQLPPDPDTEPTEDEEHLEEDHEEDSRVVPDSHIDRGADS